MQDYNTISYEGQRGKRERIYVYSIYRKLEREKETRERLNEKEEI